MAGAFSPVTLGRQINRVEAGGFVLTEAAYPPASSLPRHAHELACMTLVLKGSCTETVGRRPRECTPYSILIKPAGEVHSNRYGRGGAQCLIIEVKPERLESISSFTDALGRVEHARGGLLPALAARLYKEFRIKDSASKLAVEGLVLEMLAGVACHGPRALSPRPPHWLLEAREICDEHFTSQISLTNVAKSVGIHPAHLARTFRRHYRCTVGEYVRRLRLDYAVRELARTDKTVAEIATEVGFYDQSHFNHTFKLQTGMAPNEFRAAVKGRKSATSAH